MVTFSGGSGKDQKHIIIQCVPIELSVACAAASRNVKGKVWHEGECDVSVGIKALL